MCDDNPNMCRLLTERLTKCIIYIQLSENGIITLIHINLSVLNRNEEVEFTADFDTDLISQLEWNVISPIETSDIEIM